MAKKSRKTKHLRSTRTHDLTHGLPLTEGWRLRLARPDEIERAQTLLDLSEAQIHDRVKASITAGRSAALLQTALREGPRAMLAPLARAAAAGDPNTAFVELHAVLVAADRDDQVGAALMTIPPSTVFSKMIGPLLTFQQALHASLQVAKIQGIAVDPAHRGTGLGAAMLDAVWRLHFQAGAGIVYGQFAADSGLDAYYDTTAYEVLPKGHSLDLRPLLELPVVIHPYPGDRLFARWSTPALRAAGRFA